MGTRPGRGRRSSAPSNPKKRAKVKNAPPIRSPSKWEVNPAPRRAASSGALAPAALQGTVCQLVDRLPCILWRMALELPLASIDPYQILMCCGATCTTHYTTRMHTPPCLQGHVSRGIHRKENADCLQNSPSGSELDGDPWRAWMRHSLRLRRGVSTSAASGRGGAPHAICTRFVYEVYKKA